MHDVDSDGNQSVPARILVIDDEETVRFALQRILTHQGFEVTLAEDADAAMDACSKVQFDVVLCDIGLPGTNGSELCQVLCRRWPRLLSRVVILSGHLPDSIQRMGIPPTVPILVKPVRIATLRDTLRDRIREAGQSIDS